MDCSEIIIGFSSGEQVLLVFGIVLFLGGIIGFKIAMKFAFGMNSTRNPGGTFVSSDS